MNRIKTGKWEFTEQELARQLRDAAKRGEEAQRTEARASRVYYDGNDRRLIIELTNRVLLGIPVNRIQGLANAAPSEIEKVQLEPSGDAVRWDSLDLDFGIPGLVAGVLGTNVWMSELGRKGGSAQSEAKAIAARANGLLGGRPARETYIRSGAGKTYIIAASSFASGTAAIVSPETVARVGSHFTRAYWGRYEAMIDLYKSTKAARYAGSRVGLISSPMLPAKAAFGHIGGNVSPCKVEKLAEANSAELALAA
jgi:hypothetical protein